MSASLLRVDGLVETPIELSFDKLKLLPESIQIRDVSRLVPKKSGDGISLSGLLEMVGAPSENFWLTFHASRDEFAASIPSDPQVIETGIILYADHAAPIPVEKGGPFRFLIPDPAVCHTAELDECANVKFLDRIEITREKGRDTRPENEDEHEELHRNQ